MHGRPRRASWTAGSGAARVTCGRHRHWRVTHQRSGAEAGEDQLWLLPQLPTLSFVYCRLGATHGPPPCRRRSPPEHAARHAGARPPNRQGSVGSQRQIHDQTKFNAHWSEWRLIVGVKTIQRAYPRAPCPARATFAPTCEPTALAPNPEQKIPSSLHPSATLHCSLAACSRWQLGAPASDC